MGRGGGRGTNIAHVSEACHGQATSHFCHSDCPSCFHVYHLAHIFSPRYETYKYHKIKSRQHTPIASAPATQAAPARQPDHHTAHSIRRRTIAAPAGNGHADANQAASLTRDWRFTFYGTPSRAALPRPSAALPLTQRAERATIACCSGTLVRRDPGSPQTRAVPSPGGCCPS